MYSPEPPPNWQPAPLTGADVNRIRAGLGLSRDQLARALAVHLTTLDRWERAGRQPIKAGGLAADMLSALRDRIAREQCSLAESRRVGDLVQQALLREGSLPAFAELLRFAGRRRRLWLST